MSFSIFEDDSWDVCCLLDACRFDTFKKVNDIKGDLSKKQSVDSHTSGWIKKSLKGDYSDIVYISGNPFVSEKYFEQEGMNNPFYGIEPVWENTFNHKLNTVTAQSIMKSYSNLKDKYSDKRFFLHFMQPHHPFIGEEYLLDGGWATARNRVIGKGNKHNSGVWFNMLRNGEISKERTIKAYESNLKYVLNWVKSLIDVENDGNIVITSDHGNLFGEHGKYGHPAQTYVDELIDVPYFKIENPEDKYYPFVGLKFHADSDEQKAEFTDALGGLGYL